VFWRCLPSGTRAEVDSPTFDRNDAEPGAQTECPVSSALRQTVRKGEIVAIGWFAAFKIIPWREVVTAAPSIVQGARKLWSSVTRTEQQVSPLTVQPDEEVSSQADALSAIEARLLALESRTTEIAREAVSYSELIKSLAEQNSQLVQAVGILRLRTRVLLWFTGALGLATVGLFLWVVLHG